MSRPTPEQRAATDPAGSNWVGANAGSGKTQVLTQRVARLLLAGAEPQKILCLTYTKAAASEMQNRLFRTLGEWAMKDDAELRGILAEQTGEGADAPSDETLQRARQLFARALETPGGLKIQTIHAFCETLLRRFPLEAGVSPRFEVADEMQADVMISGVREAMAEAAERDGDVAFDRAAGQLNEGAIDDLSAAVLSRRGDIAAADLEAALDAVFGEVARMSREEIAAEALNELDLASRRLLREVLASRGGKSVEKPLAEAMAVAETKSAAAPGEAVETLLPSILTRKLEPRSTRGFPTNEVKKVHPAAEAELAGLTDWALRTRDRLLTVEAATRARDLHLFGQPLIEHYRRAKTAHGMLDFDDLIERTRDLLASNTQRAWVLFKLDQGIDHILVDEAQDTSPAQWDVIRSIADEFFAGEGARGPDRTLFVVGDEKQSIYSFQGAEPAAFGEMREHFARRLDALGKPLGRPDLITSFRSAPAVLDFVDAVFEGEAAEGLTVDGAAIRHNAHRAEDGGRVDLWPLVPRAEKSEEEPWWKPVDAPPADDARTRLAELVADRIAAMIGTETLPPRVDQPARLVGPGDILVLVARRDRLARGIIRGLKARDVPVAGADRLKLADEIAVKDLLALAKVASTPSDDLSLAALLRSPLCGISEDDLFTLAHGRDKVPLLRRVQDSAHAGVAAFLQDMIAQADYLRPYEFLERALVHHGGRARLIARLGAEAEDPIDELLVQALAFERRHPPSLAGLIHWVETSDQVVKREMDHAAGQVRVMTVHGAKGLEAPIVVLPDTIATGNAGAGRQLLLRAPARGNAPPLTLWAGAKDRDDPVTRGAREAADARTAEERRRLLYVALTRAEDWLILCGAEPGQKIDGTWYDLLQQGMARCQDVRALPSPTGAGELLRFERGPESGGEPPAPREADTQGPIALPAWLTPAPTESRRPRLSPSDLHPHEPAGGAGLGRETALLRGSAVHDLLERAGAGFDDAAARALLAHRFPALPDDLHAGILAEVGAVLAMPEAAWIFGPEALAEVAVAADPPHGGPRMTGRIDRLAPHDGGWLIIDFKTDAEVPATPPPAYLAQLGAYLAALKAGEPEVEFRAALLWTAAPTLEIVGAEAAMSSYLASRRGA